jgi:hypothetical protein
MAPILLLALSIAAGDCETMLQNGSALWQLWLFGLVTVPLGFWLWHRQGTHFGLGSAKGHVSVGVAYVSLLVCGLFLTVGFLVDGL